MPRISRLLPIGLIILLVALIGLEWIRSQAVRQPSAANSGAHYVAIVPPGMTSPFHVSIAEGARAEGAKLGWQVEVQATASESDVAGQVILVQQLLEMGAEAVSINSLQGEAIVSAVRDGECQATCRCSSTTR